jgi:hypothetical protein
MGFLNTSRSDEGAQERGTRLSIGVGTSGKTVKLTLSEVVMESLQ